MAIFAGVSVVPTWAIITVPCLMLTASVGLGLLFLVETSQSLPFDAVTVTVPYFATTISLDVLLTMLIVARLLRFCSRLVRALGEEHGKYYRYLSMVLMESASLFAMFSSMLLITEAVNSSLAYLFLQVVGQIQTISSLLIIIHTIKGKSYSDDISTKRPISSLQFDGMSTSELNSHELNTIISLEGLYFSGGSSSV